MNRRNKSGVGKERVIMLSSAVLVLTALTVTGIFVKGNNRAEKEDYIVDLEAIEEGEEQSANALMSGEELDTLFAQVGTDDLDYDPSFQEANSAKVENTEHGIEVTLDKDKKETEEGGASSSDDKEENKKENSNKTEKKAKAGKAGETDKEDDEEGMFDESADTASVQSQKAEALSTTIQPELNFQESDSLVWPIVGDVLINYSMDKTIYFPTLDQYKYNPAIVISANVGENITAAASGKIISVTNDPIIGNKVVMDLGNGYELTYGQLENIMVSEGSYVDCQDVIGTVAIPTKYYSTEGSNVYFMLTKDGQPINPMSKLQ